MRDHRHGHRRRARCYSPLPCRTTECLLDFVPAQHQLAKQVYYDHVQGLQNRRTSTIHLQATPGFVSTWPSPTYCIAITKMPSTFTNSSAGNATLATTAALPNVDFTVPGGFYYGSFAASVVNACSDSTTYALHCTDPAGALDVSSLCIPGGPVSALCVPLSHKRMQNLIWLSQTLTYTEGPTVLEFAYSTRLSGIGVFLSQSCDITPSGQASCSGSASFSGTNAATSTVYEHSQVSTYQIPITAGEAKLRSTSTCNMSTASSASMATVTGVSFFLFAAISLAAMLVL